MTQTYVRQTRSRLWTKLKVSNNGNILEVTPQDKFLSFSLTTLVPFRLSSSSNRCSDGMKCQGLCIGRTRLLSVRKTRVNSGLGTDYVFFLSPIEWCWNLNSHNVFREVSYAVFIIGHFRGRSETKEYQSRRRRLGRTTREHCMKVWKYERDYLERNRCWQNHSTKWEYGTRVYLYRGDTVSSTKILLSLCMTS